jgi:sortase A
MGERSQKRKYRRRRQQAGFVLLVSLVIVVLGGLMFTGLDPLQRAPEPVDEVAAVRLANAPEAVEEPEPEIVAVPDIPYNATEEEARKMLAENGLELGKVEKKPNDEYDKGGVFLQDPLPGVQIEEGSKVGITLSSGPEPKDPEEKAPDPGSTDLYLTVPKMGLYDNYVVNDASEAAMLNGAGKITETGFPWQDNANTYIASHVYGYQGTGSWQHFALLPSLTYGDEIILSDANGTEYVYEVTEIITVLPSDNWVTEPIAGKDMVSLQTCVGPGWSERLVVRGERVDVNTA